jgi:hypothetical protein
MDGKPAPRVPEPLFPVLRKLGVTDVQRARAWLLAWLLDRLGQRVQEPAPPAYHIERDVNGQWVPVAGPFYRAWLAAQIAREFANLNHRWHYRVIGPETTVEITSGLPQQTAPPHDD